MSDGPVSDAELLRRHLDGDRLAFGELFSRHKDRMWAVALRVSGDPELAADAVQDGFLSAFRRAGSYRGDAAVTTWLHRIVVNACLDRLRQGARARAPLPDNLVAGGDAYAAAEAAMDVRFALSKLPEAQRIAVILVDLDGMSVAEAAAVLGVPIGTVKSRCARGRTALAEVLAPRRDGTKQPRSASVHKDGPDDDGKGGGR